jgi:hypothetical protein
MRSKVGVKGQDCGRRSLTFSPDSPQLSDTGSKVDDEL